MPKFSARSMERFNTVHPQLRELLYEAIKFVDFTILAGHRNEEDQNKAYDSGKSTKRWPNSKHNSLPSEAVDIAPYFLDPPHLDWDDLAAFARLAGYIERIADEKGVKIRWGGDWNNNRRSKDERFVDMPHLEIILDR